MKVIKNLVCVLFFICSVHLLKAQVCTNETAVFEDDEIFFALPNAFTPNNDGINDMLLLFNSTVLRRKIIITNPADSSNLYITEKIDDTWNGFDMMGEIVPEGIYVLKAEYLFADSSVTIACRNIHLIRENCLDFNADSLNFPIDFNEETLQFNNNSISLPDCINSISLPNGISIRIFPNPVKEKIFFESPFPIEDVQIFLPSGQLVFHQTNLISQTIDLPDLKAGIYVIELKSRHNLFSKMIVAQ